MTDKPMTIGEYFLSAMCPVDYRVSLEHRGVRIVELFDKNNPEYPCGNCSFHINYEPHNCPIWQMDIETLKGVGKSK